MFNYTCTYEPIYHFITLSFRISTQNVVRKKTIIIIELDNTCNVHKLFLTEKDFVGQIGHRKKINQRTSSTRVKERY